MTDDLAATLARLHAAVATFDPDGVEDAIRQLEWFTHDDGTWGDELFVAVTRLLGDDAFLNAGTSYRLVRALELDWAVLSPEQRQALRPLLARAFDKFGDWLGAQLTAEIFGEHYADESAFETLETLSRSAATRPARALAAYGLGVLARTIERGVVFDRAVGALNVLAADEDPDVFTEARDALERLRRS